MKAEDFVRELENRNRRAIQSVGEDFQDFTGLTIEEYCDYLLKEKIRSRKHTIIETFDLSTIVGKKAKSLKVIHQFSGSKILKELLAKAFRDIGLTAEVDPLYNGGSVRVTWPELLPENRYA
jgi:hypothetical protein